MVAFDGSIGKVLSIRDTATWAYDGVAHSWSKISGTGPTPSRTLSALAYDPDNRVVLLFGGSDGQYYSSQLNDTWIFKSSDSNWTKLPCPGIPKFSNALIYQYCMTWDPVHHCMLLSDPDLGVWAFKYSPASPIGTTVIDAESLIVCKSLNNTPASGQPETMISFTPTVNSKIRDLPDNTMIAMAGSAVDGGEIMWDYDWVHGIAVNYAGCGNSASPYWTHYGNNVSIYKPGEEKCYIRRVGEVSGANRPATGCTRSTFYDSKRNVWWLFGGTSSGTCPEFS
jgi:hypothetical protein